MTRRQRGGRAARVGLVLGLALALVLLVVLPAGAAALPQQPLPVRVTFNGSGLFMLHNAEGADDHAMDDFAWTVQYQAVLEPDGALEQSTALPVTNVGNYEFNNGFGVSCSGPIPATPTYAIPGDPNPPPAQAPPPQANGMQIQSVTYLSDKEYDPAYSGCQGGPNDYDARGEAASDVAGALDQSLPGVMTAVIVPVPRPVLLASGAALNIQHTTSQSAPEQLPQSCSSYFGIDDPNKCTMSINWTGTVIIDGTAACPLILAGPPLTCLPQQGVTETAFLTGFDVNASGPGTASMSATTTGGVAAGIGAARSKHLVIATGKVKAKHAGKLRLRPHLTPAGSKALKHSHELKVAVQITFKPKSGASHVTRFNTTLRAH